MKNTIELAREVYGAHTEWAGAPLNRLEQLVALVRADEREQCALVAEDSDHVVGGRGYYDQLGNADATVRNIAAAIRARGQG
jgi:hypothetical protein